MLKKEIRVINKRGLWYIVKNGDKCKRFRPWLGDAFSFLYDGIMEHSIFPKKFRADIKKHYEILTQELRGIHGKRILELATGSGSAVNFLERDNRYTGTDISPGLLRKAVKKFRIADFKEAEFYVTDAHDLPFDDNTFDVCLCILSLNFVSDVRRVFLETKRVLAADGIFICSVPVPERNRIRSTIRGVLHSEQELQEICQTHGFRFEGIPFENGALLYFKGLLAA